MRRHFLYVFCILSLMAAMVISADDTDNYTLFSDGNLILRDRVSITDGFIGSNTYTQMGYDVILSGSILSKGNLKLQDRAIVNGNATLGGVLSGSPSSVKGIFTQNATVPYLTIPVSSVTPGSTDLIVSQGVKEKLGPSAFRDVTVASGATLYLIQGEHYVFRNLILSDNATLFCDCSSGQVLIDVLNTLTIGNNVRIIAGVKSFSPPYIYIYSHQTATLVMGNDCSIQAYLTLPRAAVTVGDRTVLNGKLRAKSITIGYDVDIMDNMILDNDGDGMSDHWETANGLNPFFNDSASDADGDGLNNGIEFKCKTNPNLSDTDNDGINDGNEYAYWQDSIKWYDDIEPYNPATGTSGDGLHNIIDPDSDNDGLLDGEEIAGWSVIAQGFTRTVTTDPAKIDSDYDKIPDGKERDGYNIDFPNHTINNTVPQYMLIDNDGDQVDDGVEISYGLDPNNVHTQGYMHDKKLYDMVNHMGEWAVSPLTGHLNPQLASTSTGILGANMSFGDSTATEMSIDRQMELCFFLPQDGQPLTIKLEFIYNGTPDINDRFYDISYSGLVYPNGNSGAPPIQYSDAETNSITWTIASPLYYLKGDYFLNFSCHYDKNAGEQPRTIRMYAYYNDGTRARMEYISPVKEGVYGTPLHFDLLVTGGAQPAFFRGETAVSSAAASYIDNVVVTDFSGSVVRNIGKKAFNGYWFQYELGILNTYSGGTSGLSACNRLQFDWVHDPLTTKHHCIFAIDEIGNKWDDVQITYQASNHTQDYSCWSGGVAKETAVIRRGDAVHVVVTKQSLQNNNAQVTVRNRAGADVTSQFVVHKEAGYGDYSAFDGQQGSWRENWIIETPSTMPVGMYTVQMRIGSWTGSASFNLIFNRNEMSISDEAYAYQCYDEDTDGLALDTDDDAGIDMNGYLYSPDSSLPLIASLDPFTNLVTGIASASIDGKTTLFDARDAVRRFVAELIIGCWSCSTYTAGGTADQMLLRSGVTVNEVVSGIVQADHQLFGDCTHFTKASVAFSRAIGIPSRVALGRGVYMPQQQPDQNGIYRPGTSTWVMHLWSEAWTENPPTGSDKWYVYDATKYVHTIAGCSVSRRDYSVWLVPDAQVWVCNPMENVAPYYLP